MGILNASQPRQLNRGFCSSFFSIYLKPSSYHSIRSTYFLHSIVEFNMTSNLFLKGSSTPPGVLCLIALALALGSPAADFDAGEDGDAVAVAAAGREQAAVVAGAVGRLLEFALALPVPLAVGDAVWAVGELAAVGRMWLVDLFPGLGRTAFDLATTYFPLGPRTAWAEMPAANTRVEAMMVNFILTVDLTVNSVFKTTFVGGLLKIVE